MQQRSDCLCYARES